MNFEPQKFFIIRMDFFTILLMGDLSWVVLENRFANLSGAEAWAAFLFASYRLGHLVFLLGSRLDGIYDWLCDQTLNRHVMQVASRGRLLS